MRELRLTMPELALVAGTRGALGVGLGLLIADRLSPDQRKAMGWTLLAVGIVSTVPLAIEVLSKSVTTHTDGLAEPSLSALQG